MLESKLINVIKRGPGLEYTSLVNVVYLHMQRVAVICRRYEVALFFMVIWINIWLDFNKYVWITQSPVRFFLPFSLGASCRNCDHRVFIVRMDMEPPKSALNIVMGMNSFLYCHYLRISTRPEFCLRLWFSQYNTSHPVTGVCLDHHNKFKIISFMMPHLRMTKIRIGARRYKYICNYMGCNYTNVKM